MTGIDLNRAGTPYGNRHRTGHAQCREAVAYAKALHSLVMWQISVTAICRKDLSVATLTFPCGRSARKNSARCEIKNLNSFRFLEEAINIEVRRQIELIEDGGTVVQETRLYDPDRKETRSMRSKEDSQDYRYFPDPDLPPLKISREWVEQVRATMPELPSAMRQRFIEQFGLPEYDATILTQSKGIATYFEAIVQAAGVAQAKPAANLMMGDITLNREGVEISAIPVSAAQQQSCLQRIADGTISNKIAKEVFAAMWQTPSADVNLADQVIGSKRRQISDVGALEKLSMK
jgi:aspartyl-tRNA(Asn)/glutamyl-tRNA(Gln) amidotransferase subunit B